MGSTECRLIMNFNEPQNIGGLQGMTSSVRFLLILNVSIYIGERLFGLPFSGWFALPAIWWETLSFGKLFTYMFIHANFNHLLVNMIGLFFIGPAVERTMGSYRFMILFYLSGILGGLGWSLLALPGTYCVGASGGLMGTLGAFAALYPNARLLLWFIFPVRAWVLVLGLALWELSETISAPRIGGIANAAHLMGGIAGFSYAFAWKDGERLQHWWARFSPFGGQSSQKSFSERDPVSSEEINRILEKIGREGMGSLTPSERASLQRATRR